MPQFRKSCTTVHFGSSCLPYSSSLVLFLCWYYTGYADFSITSVTSGAGMMLLEHLEEGMGMNKCIRANPDTKSFTNFSNPTTFVIT